MAARFPLEASLLDRFDDLIVIDKPPGWPTTGRDLTDEDCVQFHLLKHFGSMVWALHQLDADTSGLCLFTLSRPRVQELKAIWSDPATRKEYLAIVHDVPAWNTHEEKARIGPIAPHSLGVSPDGKPAHTTFEVLARTDGFSLLRAHLFTGRTHQIRIHLQHLGYPLVGEGWYRETPCTLHPRQALHAASLTFPVAVALPQSRFTAPLAADLVQLAKRLGLPLDFAQADGENGSDSPSSPAAFCGDTAGQTQPPSS